MSNRKYGYILAGVMCSIPVFIGVGGLVSAVLTFRVGPAILGGVMLALGWTIWRGTTRIADQKAKLEEMTEKVKNFDKLSPEDVELVMEWANSAGHPSGVTTKKKTKKKPKPLNWKSEPKQKQEILF